MKQHRLSRDLLATTITTRTVNLVYIHLVSINSVRSSIGILVPCQKHLYALLAQLHGINLRRLVPFCKEPPHSCTCTNYNCIPYVCMLECHTIIIVVIANTYLCQCCDISTQTISVLQSIGSKWFVLRGSLGLSSFSENTVRQRHKFLDESNI